MTDVVSVCLWFELQGTQCTMKWSWLGHLRPSILNIPSPSWAHRKEGMHAGISGCVPVHRSFPPEIAFYTWCLTLLT